MCGWTRVKEILEARLTERLTQWGVHTPTDKEMKAWVKLVCSARVSINHIHFKYEDSDTSKGNEFVMGFAVDSVRITAIEVRTVPDTLTAVACDAQRCVHFSALQQPVKDRRSSNLMTL